MQTYIYIYPSIILFYCTIVLYPFPWKPESNSKQFEMWYIHWRQFNRWIAKSFFETEGESIGIFDFPHFVVLLKLDNSFQSISEYLLIT